jgi:hypothetical protein
VCAVSKKLDQELRLVGRTRIDSRQIIGSTTIRAERPSFVAKLTAVKGHGTALW